MSGIPFPREYVGGLRAGKLDTLVILERRIEIVDAAMAMQEPDWQEIARMWARIEQQIGFRKAFSEGVYAEQVVAVHSFRVFVRTPLPAEINERDRVLILGDETHPLNVLNVVFPDQRRTHAVLLCEQGLNSG